jgi:hypothetical protein
MFSSICNDVHQQYTQLLYYSYDASYQNDNLLMTNCDDDDSIC